MDEIKTDIGIEESFLKLDEILLKLESQDTGLEESFRLYEEGLKIVKAAEESIEKVEKQITVLREKIN